MELIHHGFERMPDRAALAYFNGFRNGWDGESLIELKYLVEGARRTA